MKKMFFFVVATVVLFSCNSVDNSSLRAIHHLQKETDSLTDVVNDLPKDSLELMYQTTKEKLDFFRRLNILLPNKLHQSIVSEWSYSFKFFKKQKSKPAGFFYQLNVSKKQLNDLKDDIKNNMWSDEEIQKFVDDEQQALEKTKLEIKEFLITMDKEQRKFNRLYPEINEIIDSLQHTQ